MITNNIANTVFLLANTDSKVETFVIFFSHKRSCTYRYMTEAP